MAIASSFGSPNGTALPSQPSGVLPRLPGTTSGVGVTIPQHANNISTATPGSQSGQGFNPLSVGSNLLNGLQNHLPTGLPTVGTQQPQPFKPLPTSSVPNSPTSSPFKPLPTPGTQPKTTSTDQGYTPPPMPFSGQTPAPPGGGVMGAGPAPEPPKGISASPSPGGLNNPGMISAPGAGNTDQGYKPPVPPGVSTTGTPNFGPGPTDQGGGLPVQPPQPPVPTGTSAVGGATATPFTANQNLVGQQLNPTASPATQQYGNLTMQAAQNLGSINEPALAQQEFNTFAQQSDPAYQLALRQATQAASATGSLGSGQLETSYGDLANQRNLQLTGEQQALEENALQQQVGEQNAQAQILGGLQGQSFNQGQTNYADLAQQQGYQNALSQQAIGNNENELALENQLGNSQFANNLALAQFAYGGNPSATESQIGGQYGEEAGQLFGAAGGLAGNQAYNASLYGPSTTPQVPGTNAVGSYIDPNAGLTTTDYGNTGGALPGYIQPPPSINATYPTPPQVYDPTTGLPYSD